jgi:CRISPR/Cas system-associated exonuclease Cas4 (RecB family)
VRHPTRGLVVVDYKTDQLADATDRVQRLRRYGVQLAAYGIALEELLGEPVNAGILVLCTTSGPAGEFDVPDWSSVKAALRARLLTQP